MVGAVCAPSARGQKSMSQVKRKALSAGEATHSNEGEPVAPAINEVVQEQIGAKLKALFDESAAQPVPDRFVELLQALAQKEDGNHAD